MALERKAREGAERGALALERALAAEQAQVGCPAMPIPARVCLHAIVSRIM